MTVQVGFWMECFPACGTLTGIPFVMSAMDMVFEIAASFEDPVAILVGALQL
jgi:hypothetical protein